MRKQAKTKDPLLFPFGAFSSTSLCLLGELECFFFFLIACLLCDLGFQLFLIVYANQTKSYATHDRYEVGLSPIIFGSVYYFKQ